MAGRSTGTRSSGDKDFLALPQVQGIDNNSSRSPTTKKKLKIWKKVKSLRSGKRSASTSQASVSPVPSGYNSQEDDDNSETESQLEELDRSPSMHHRSLVARSPDSPSVQSASPETPPFTPESNQSLSSEELPAVTVRAETPSSPPIARHVRSNSVDLLDAGHTRLSQSNSLTFWTPHTTASLGHVDTDRVRRSSSATQMPAAAQARAALGVLPNSGGGNLSPLQKRLGLGTPNASLDEPQSVESSPPTSTEASGFPYLLTVVVVSGHNLASRDSNGLSDPYIKLKVGASGFSKAKTSTVYKSLSPIWNETFDLGVYSLTDSLMLRVFDKDIIGTHDPMGRSVINLSKLPLGIETEMRLALEATEGCNITEELGYIMVKLTLQSFAAIPPDVEMLKRKRGSVFDSSSTLKKRHTRQPSGQQDSTSSCHKKGGCVNITRSILSVTLLSGTTLAAMDENGLSDPYCKFRLGPEKWKSRVINKTLNPEWKEKFEMRMIDGQCDTLQVHVYDKDYASKDDFMGSCEVDVSSLAPDVTHNITRTLGDFEGEINFLLTITGLKDPSEFDGMDPQDPESLRTPQVLDSYSLRKTPADMTDVGILMVKVIRAAGLAAADIGGNSDPFVTVELGNSMVRTETVYKNRNPEWNKCFFLKIKDIHSVLDVLVQDEDRDGSEFLGRINIPLLSIVPGETRLYALKDTKLRSLFKGQIELQCDLIYNPVRASIRTFNPAEKKYIEASDKFSRQILSANITRVAALVRAISAFLEFVNSIFLWKRKVQSLMAFLVFVVVVLIFDLWMVFAFLLTIFMVQYFRNNVGMGARSNPERSAEDAVSTDDDDDDKVQDKKGLKQRLQDLYNICLTVQNALDMVASLGERVKNTVNWRVPFQSWLAMTVLTVAMVVTYVIPLRYLILLWGINKFTKRLRKPNFIPNNELLDFFSRTPSDPELVERTVIAAHVDTKKPTSPTNRKKKKRQ